jgi:hypothetical protein
MLYSLTADTKDVVAFLEKHGQELQKLGPFLMVWGNAVAKEARQNARAKGGRNLWREIARATRVEKLGQLGVAVACYHVAGGHKQFGGPIVATNAKALTIPIAPEAEGKRAAEFELGGRELFVPKGTHVLGYSDDEGQFHALFVLVKRTKPQRAFPWMPGAERVGEIGMSEAARWLKKLAA